MKYGLGDTVLENLNDVFAAFCDVDAVILYGSRAKGNYKPGSDFDLIFKGKLLTYSTLRDLFRITSVS